MKAMILAAGFGTRLWPLTETRPKALVPVGTRPLIDHNLKLLKRHGVENVVINAHHLAQQIVDYFAAGERFGMPVQVRVEAEILGTGGGIRNTADFWGKKPFVVINGDILTDLDLGAAYRAHCMSGHLVTLVLHRCEPFNQVAVDAGLNIVDIATENRPGRLAFTGVHIMDPRVLGAIPERGYADIVACYRDLIARDGGLVGAYVSHGHHWRDMGTIAAYVAGNRECVKDGPVLAGSDCRMDPSVRCLEWAVIGGGAVLEEGAVVRRSILWENVTVRRGISITDSIVTADRVVGRHVKGEIC